MSPVILDRNYVIVHARVLFTRYGNYDDDDNDDDDDDDDDDRE